MSAISGMVTLKTATRPFEGGRILRNSEFFQNRCLGTIFQLGEFLSKIFIFGFYVPVSEYFKEKAIQIRESERGVIVHIDLSESEEIEEVLNLDTQEYEEMTSESGSKELALESLSPIRLSPEVTSFEGGKILRDSEFFQTRCLGIIFYLGELLSKVLLLDFCFPVKEWLKEQAIQIREKEERSFVLIDRKTSQRISEKVVVLEPDMKVEEIDPILKRLAPVIDREVDKIYQRYRQGSTDTDDLSNTVADLVISLKNKPYSLIEQEIIQKAKPVFVLFVSKLAKKINVAQDLQKGTTESLSLFLRSIQAQKILSE